MAAGGQPETVVRRPLDWDFAPEEAALLVRGDARPFALVGTWADSLAVIGSEPVRVAGADEDPFALLDDLLPATGPAGAVAGGWFGYLGYELARRLEPVGASPPVAETLPPFALAFYDHVLRLDRDGQWWFEALWTSPRADALDRRMTELTGRAAAPRPFTTDLWRATPGPVGHGRAVAACRERIHAGDLFQANICVRLDSRLDGDPLDLFAQAAAALRPDRAAFVAGPWGAVASLSPELFLQRSGRHVLSAPIKGTRELGGRAELESSGKDHAENVMIVDLVRNDLGRVSTPGTVEVASLARPRPHTGVWHLVSEVTGTLRDGVGDGELVRAAFPPGSVTGAPKVAAMNVIAELESTARGVYTGAIGFASPLAGLELNVAIRTFEVCRDRVWLGVGGGIVADSDPGEETREWMTKAAPLLAAIGGELAPASPDQGAPEPARTAPRPVPRPDPAAGVFETVLVAGGRPVALDEHLARLERSVHALYARELPAALADELLAAARDAGDARLRVNVTPKPFDLTFGLTPLGPRTTPVRLVPRSVPGGLGAHKWIDRRLLESLRDGSGDGEPLLCDLDGLVLESARANVFCIEAGSRLVTPPLDGRILPGVTRARVLDGAERLGLTVVVEPLALGRLQRAQEIFVTGSLGGVEPAYLDGSPPPRSATVAVRLAATLTPLVLAAA
ncbi:MAG TPA: aminodeoxychorismate synthase component I [Solirubrobacteraceae bacterium]|nr:aminodeoxychorismate synthase component I [Solirubrobacteraceae bacterium]